MKKIICTLYFLLSTFFLLAAVPLKWTVETSRVQPVVFDAVRGETLALEASFNSYGTPLQLPANAALFYQTNGMESAWWMIPATVSATNRISAVFAPTNDPGAASVVGFLGTTGEIYRAAFTLRFRHGPGATPNAIAVPVPVLDFAKTTVVNPPWTSTNDFQTATNGLACALSSHTSQLSQLSHQTNLWNTATNKQDRISDYTTTNAVEAISSSASVTNAGAVAASTNAAKAYTDAKFSGITVSSIGAYPNASGEQLATQVAVQGAHLNAEDAQAVVTNYDSNTHLREMKLRIKLTEGNTNSWIDIWNEMDRWNAFTGTNFNWKTWVGFCGWSQTLAETLADKGEKEYAFYDGVTGNVAPDGFFWISQPRIAICAGAAYQRYVESGGMVWLLESNGLVADINGTTNGFFRITDEEGNSQFEIVKGDKTTVVATCGSMVHTNILNVTHWYCQYAVTNAVAAPTAKFSRTLTNPTWYADTDASCPMNVSWTAGLNNTYKLEFWPKSDEPTMFVKAEYVRGGETRIKQSVPVEMQYIILNGTKYSMTPKTVGGELVLGLTRAN